MEQIARLNMWVMDGICWPIVFPILVVVLATLANRVARVRVWKILPLYVALLWSVYSVPFTPGTRAIPGGMFFFIIVFGWWMAILLAVGLFDWVLGASTISDVKNSGGVSLGALYVPVMLCFAWNRLTQVPLEVRMQDWPSLVLSPIVAMVVFEVMERLSPPKEKPLEKLPAQK